jgi:hypothetical protein
MEVGKALEEGKRGRWRTERKGGGEGPGTMALVASCLAVPDGDMK